MHVEDLDDWDHFERRLAELEAEHGGLDSPAAPLLFRGQRDSQWPLATTLERESSAPLNLISYYAMILRAKPQIETFTGERWPLASLEEYRKRIKSNSVFPFGSHNEDGPPSQSNLPEAECQYLIFLRHHGFPSPLLDWTRSPYVAAFFAFNQAASERVAIFAYLGYVIGKAWKLDHPNIATLGPLVTAHPRHFGQQSEYTICFEERDGEWFYAPHEQAISSSAEHQISLLWMPMHQDVLWKFTLPASQASAVLKRLDRFNINAFSLFGSTESLMQTVALREFKLRTPPHLWFWRILAEQAGKARGERYPNEDIGQGESGD